MLICCLGCASSCLVYVTRRCSPCPFPTFHNCFLFPIHFTHDSFTISYLHNRLSFIEHSSVFVFKPACTSTISSLSCPPFLTPNVVGCVLYYLQNSMFACFALLYMRDLNWKDDTVLQRCHPRIDLIVGSIRVQAPPIVLLGCTPFCSPFLVFSDNATSNGRYYVFRVVAW